MKYLLAFLLIAGLSHGQASIKEEFYFSPMKEMTALRNKEISNPDIIKRLVRVDDNFTDFWEHYKKLSLSKDKNTWDLNSPLILRRYEQIYMDPTTTNYYLGLLRFPRASETNGFKQINWGNPKKKSDRNRLVFISNLSPSKKLMADAANEGMLYIQRVIFIPDFYKGYASWGYLYFDPENKNPLKVTPITNQKTGTVIYKGLSPNSGRTFYAYRQFSYYANYAFPQENSHDPNQSTDNETDDKYALEGSGYLNGFSNDLKEVWEWRVRNAFFITAE